MSGGTAPKDWLSQNLYESDPSPSSLPTLALRTRKLGVDVNYDRNAQTYTLSTPVKCDVQALFEHLNTMRIDEALALYYGPFLAGIHSPFATQVRMAVESAFVRSAVSSGDPVLMARVDRVIKHPELGDALARSAPDTPQGTLSHVWLATMAP